MKKNKKIIGIIVVVLLVGIIGSFLIINKIFKKDEDISFPTKYGYLVGEFSNVEVTDEESARQALNDVRSYIGVIDTFDDLELSYEYTLGDTTYYRFKQYYEDILVYNKEVLFEVNNNKAENLVYNSLTLTDFETEFKNTKEDLIKALEEKIGSLEVIKEEEIIYVLNDPVMAYLFIINQAGEEKSYIVTDNKDIIDENYQYYEATYDLNKMDEVKVDLKDGVLELANNNIGIYESEEVTKGEEKVFGYFYNKVANLKKGTNLSAHEKAALLYVNDIYNYYKNKLGYESFDGRGEVPIRLFIDIENMYDDQNQTVKKKYDNAGYGSTVNYSYEGIIINACKNCESIYNHKVLGHEFTHGVINHIVGSGDLESDSVNEAYADIMGLLIDWEYTNTKSYNISDRNIDKIKSPYLTKYEANKLNQNDPHKNGTILTNIFYKISKDVITDTNVLSNLFFKSLYLLPSEGGFIEATNAIILTAEQLNKAGTISDEQLNDIKKIFKDAKLGVSFENNSNNLDTGYFLTKDFQICANTKDGDYLHEYYLTIDKYNAKNKLVDTIVSKNIKSDSCYKTNIPVSGSSRTSYDNYYVVKISKDGVETKATIITLPDKYAINNKLNLFLNTNDNDVSDTNSYLDNYIKVGSRKVDFGSYMLSNNTSDSLITLNKGGNCAYKGAKATNLGENYDDTCSYKVLRKKLYITLKNGEEIKFSVLKDNELTYGGLIYLKDLYLIAGKYKISYGTYKNAFYEINLNKDKTCHLKGFNWDDDCKYEIEQYSGKDFDGELISGYHLIIYINEKKLYFNIFADNNFADTMSDFTYLG